jgi:ABC-type spermidine/putrescine transport system permease subunit I
MEPGEVGSAYGLPSETRAAATPLGRALPSRALPYLLIAPVAIYLAVIVIGPELIQIFYSFLTREQGVFAYHVVLTPTLDNYLEIFRESQLRESLLWTVGSSMVIAIGTVIFGLPVAHYLARGTGRGKLLVEMALLLPLFGDIFTGYALLYAFAPQGIINWALLGLGLIKQPLHLIGNPAAAAFAMMLPGLSVLLMRSALMRVDTVYEEAAQMLGANPLRAWWSTTFAIARVGIVGAFLLTFAGGTGAYTLPLIIAGGDNPWFGQSLWRVYQFNNLPLASAMSILMVLLTAGIIYLNIRLSGRGSKARRYVG